MATESLSYYRDAAKAASAKASNVARQIAFAGIAAIWIFRSGNALTAAIPQQLYIPLLLFLATLAQDLLQYLWGASAWHWFFRYHEKLGKASTDQVNAPTWMIRPLQILFWTKVTTVVVATVWLMTFLAGRLWC